MNNYNASNLIVTESFSIYNQERKEALENLFV